MRNLTLNPNPPRAGYTNLPASYLEFLEHSYVREGVSGNTGNKYNPFPRLAIELAVLAQSPSLHPVTTQPTCLHFSAPEIPLPEIEASKRKQADTNPTSNQAQTTEASKQKQASTDDEPTNLERKTMNPLTSQPSLHLLDSPLTHCFIDVETGGLDDKTDALLSIGAVMFNPQTGVVGNTEKTTFCRYIKPFDNAKFSIEALGVNGITVPDMMAAHTETEAYRALSHWMITNRLETIWAHNAPFDEGFLRAFEMRVRDSPALFRPRNSFLCSKQLLTLAKVKGLYPAGSLTRLSAACGYFDIPLPNAHQSDADAIAGAHLVCKLWQLLGWADSTTTNPTTHSTTSTAETIGTADTIDKMRLFR